MQRNRTVSQLARTKQVSSHSNLVFNQSRLRIPISELSPFRAISALKSLSTLSTKLANFECNSCLEVSMGPVTHRQLDAHVLQGPDHSAVRI